MFGLDVYAHTPPSLLRGTAARATGRTVELSMHTGGLAALDWPAGAEVISRQHQADGRGGFRIERHAQAGYLIAGETYGAFALSRDGGTLRCARGDADERSWQRLLIAQALPFAAVLKGLEVFHSSAVVIDGRAIAFAGPSRAGKTSLALELCRLGARFLADDVLALQRRGDALLGHPGTAVAGVDHAETRRVDDGPQNGRPLFVDARERLVAVAGVAAPAPLRTLYLLDRRTEGPAKPCFEAVTDARQLLAATFNFVLATPQRLRDLLEVCALVAWQRVERISIGPSVDAAQLGLAVRERIAQAP